MRMAQFGQLTLFAAMMAGCVANPRFAGPMPVRNQHPAQLTVMHMPPAAASVLPRGAVQGRADVAYTSLFLNGQSFGDAFYMDGEYLRSAASARFGLGRGFEAGVSLPFAHTSGGFLDDFLIDYHDAFGFPDQDRQLVPKDDFRIDATKNGLSVWSVERRSFEPLDVPLSLTWQATDPTAGDLGVALRAGLELPVGDDDRGYGNGEVDFAAGVLLEQRWRDVAFYGHLQHTLAGTPSRSASANFEFADVTALGIGAELPLTERLSALVQFEYETSTLRDLSLRAASRKQFLIWIGGRWQLPWGALELGFGEDIQAFVSPDFTAWLGFTTPIGNAGH